MPKLKNPRDKITKIYLILLLLIPISLFAYSLVDMLAPFEPQATYKILLIDQFPLNKEDVSNGKQYVQAIASGDEAFLKYYFQIENKDYYILQDVVYSIEGSEMAGLQPKSEGYFTYNGNFYYVYGDEKRKTKNTLGGPVGYRYKDYKYRKLDLYTKQEIEITKNEYESLYFKIDEDMSEIKIVEEPTKPDLVSLSRKVSIETLVLPDISEMASYTDIEVMGETIRFKYKNMTFVESVKDLKPENIVGGLVVQEKQVLLANGVKAKWISVSNHMDNIRGASAGLYLSNYGTNVAIIIGSMEPVKESETQAVAEALYYKQITNTFKK